MIRDVEYFLEFSANRKYEIFQNISRDFNLNIVGWRNKEANINLFDDFLTVYWKTVFGWKSKEWPITTYPGKPWLLNPINKSGAAILVPGQYLESYELGVYKSYIALKEIKSIKVYRDNNKDGEWNLDEGSIQEGIFGIHIHRAGIWSKIVGLNSAGCQVFSKKKDFEEFIGLCQMAKKNWGNKFSYTLMEF